MTQNPFKTKEFEALSQKWDNILEKSGFKDAERKDKIGKSEGRLKTDMLENVARGYNKDRFDNIQEYYRLAGQFLYDYKFASPVDQKIWELHSEGLSIARIVEKVKKSGSSAFKDSVQRTINNLKQEMKKYARNREIE